MQLPEPDDPLNYISANPRLAAGILAAKKAKKLIKGAPAIRADEGRRLGRVSVKSKKCYPIVTKQGPRKGPINIVTIRKI